MTVNVYYTISNSVVLDLFSGPLNYTSSLNYTKGNLAATAYRTRTTDNWNFKYYRYDIRGRVIKLWNIISDFDTLITEYYYNSQDQITKYSHSGQGDVRTYRNIYDYAGRLHKVDYYTGSPDALDPDYLNLAEYEYNPNSQISIQKYNDAFMQNEYSYNERNWITEVDNSSKLFEYSNRYFKNGNVKSMEISGDYSQNFAAPSGLTFEYEYDRSNRLTKATNGENIFEVINTYDKDGNILSMERHGSTGIRIEAFNYIYYSGTNKLQRVSGGGTQYTYDANGNMISDALNKNVNIEYDHRNLILELEHTKYILNDSLILLTKYYYDEAGNRIRKMTYDTEDDSLKSDIIYSRDVSGRELAVYENNGIKQWNLFGLDNIGYMTGSDELRFYLKDHLGSVRVVTDNQSAVINCQDYDQWGYVLENRNYQSDESMYKFTSKERDEESEYDYFGARYYDARVGRWNQLEPLLDKYVQISPYIYSLDNPLNITDLNGADPIRENLGSLDDVISILNDNTGKSYWELSKVFSNAKVQYIATEKAGFIDLEHFFAAASISKQSGKISAIVVGELVELGQYLSKNVSAFNQEDPRSNVEGAEFGFTYKNSNRENVAENFTEYFNQLVSIAPTDPRLAEENVYIPANRAEYLSNPLPQRIPPLLQIPLIGVIPVLNFEPSFGADPKNHSLELKGF